jgi:hypothetical protein
MELSLPVQFKDKYLKLIAAGKSESIALRTLGVDWMDFFELCAKDPDFRKDIDNARKARAEVWVSKIVESVEPKYLKDSHGNPTEVERIPSKDETMYRKLQFDQLKFLAKADNPERYGDAGGSRPTVEINLNDFKLLSPQEAIKTLNNDPFNKLVTIEAETSTPKEK